MNFAIREDTLKDVGYQPIEDVVVIFESVISEQMWRFEFRSTGVELVNWMPMLTQLLVAIWRHWDTMS